MCFCSIDNWIEQNLDSGKVTSRNQVSSSSWSSAYVYETDNGTKYFVKQSQGGADEGMFKGEALGLEAMYGGLHYTACMGTAEGCACVLTC